MTNARSLQMLLLQQRALKQSEGIHRKEAYHGFHEDLVQAPLDPDHREFLQTLYRHFHHPTLRTPRFFRWLNLEENCKIHRELYCL